MIFNKYHHEDISFVPGIPIKRHSPCESPNQNPIPQIIKRYEITNEEIKFIGYIPNERYYPEFIYLIQQFIDTNLSANEMDTMMIGEYTTIGIAGSNNGEFFSEEHKIYYSDYPPPDGYERMPYSVKSPETKKEWENWWNAKPVYKQMNKSKESLKMFDAILHREWEKGEKDTEIIHFWAEDMATVGMHVPHQLRDEIVEMQNWLSKKYQKINELKFKLSEASRFFDGEL